MKIQILALICCCLLVYVNSTTPSPEDIEDALVKGAATLNENKSQRRRMRASHKDKVQTRSSRGKLEKIKEQKQKSKQIEDVAIVSIAATQELVSRTGSTMEELRSCSCVTEAWQSNFCGGSDGQSQTCDKDAKYRTADGSCNNLRNTAWGKSFTAQSRYLAPDYADGISTARSHGVGGAKLPSARKVSNAVLRNIGSPQVDTNRTIMVMAWGQFVDHDMVLTPGSQGEEGTSIECCDVTEERLECLPIDIPSDDPHFSANSKTCMNFVRSAPATEDICLPGYREQINQLTSFIDASNVYGSTSEETAALREFKDGLMRTSGADNLPPAGPEDTCILTSAENHCLHAGDVRVNEVPNLGANHVVFLREHNRIAVELKKYNPKWSDETLFQESRKIVAALMQSITYYEWLPAVLSRKYREKFSLKSSSSKNIYDETVDPSIKNSFAVAALRFGHSLIPPTLAFLLHDYLTFTGENNLENTFFNTDMVTGNDGQNLPKLLRFISSSHSMSSDRFLEPSVRDLLFHDPAGNSFDLGALNMQRGRDHGTPSYNQWRKYCDLPQATDFDSMPSHKAEVALLLKSVYDHVDDIDLYAGAVSEELEKDGDVGPTFSCILGKQFKDLKYGDRFWFENEGRQGFKSDQLDEIKKMKLSKILCRNFAMDRIQKDVFHKIGQHDNRLESCDSLPDMNLKKWQRKRRSGKHGKRN